jgi:hypothetical protein
MDWLLPVIGSVASLFGAGSQANAQNQENQQADQYLGEIAGNDTSILNQYQSDIWPMIQSLMAGGETNALQESGQGLVQTLMAQLGGGGAAANPGLLAKDLLTQNDQTAMQTSANNMTSLLQLASQPMSGALSSLGGLYNSVNSDAGSYGNPWASGINSAISDLSSLSGFGVGSNYPTSTQGGIPTFQGGTVNVPASQGATPNAYNSVAQTPAIQNGSATPQSTAQSSTSPGTSTQLPGYTPMSGSPFGGFGGATNTTSFGTMPWPGVPSMSPSTAVTG